MKKQHPVLGPVATLFEDDHFIFLSKPPGLATSASQRRATPGVNELIPHIRPTAGDSLEQLYSLPRSGGGVCGFAKSPTALRQFQWIRSKQGVRCTFLAVCRGEYKIQRFKGANAPHAVSTPKTKETTRRRNQTGAGAALKSTIRKGTPIGPGDATKERWTGGAPVIEAVHEGKRRILVRVVCGDPTGRTVRSALLAARLPIVGDPENDPRREGILCGRMWLHLEEIAFSHPVTAAPIRVWQKTPDVFLDAANEKDTLDHDLECAIAARLTLIAKGETDVYRIVDGRRDSFPGLIVDKLGKVLIAQTDQGKFEGGADRVRRVARALSQSFDVDSLYWKPAPKDRGKLDPELAAVVTNPKPLWGKPAAEEFVAIENGLRFLIRPFDGQMVGLFVDQRENRQWIRDNARGKRVLNTFAYTCGFSVAAASGGALHVASVDLSRKSLEWGKQNFAVNDLSLDDHKFYCSDIFDFFDRAKRQNLTYDIIILDPPTFARDGKSTFQVERDMSKLVSGALNLIEKGGTLLVCANHRAASLAWLKEQVTSAAANQRLRFLAGPNDPPDITDNRAAAKSVFVAVD